jgi:hypothetical protein
MLRSTNHGGQLVAAAISYLNTRQSLPLHSFSEFDLGCLIYGASLSPKKVLKVKVCTVKHGLITGMPHPCI